MKPSYSVQYLAETAGAVALLDCAALERMAGILSGVRRSKGRLFILGVGGGAGHASHAVNDFRKIAGIESYAPTDNVSELTARINDEGWESAYAEWLKTSRLGRRDALLVFSVSGGDRRRKVSLNLARAVDLARARGARVLAVTGPDGGHCRSKAHACVRIPAAHAGRVTVHTEGLQAVVWHLLVSHPKLALHETRWEELRSRRS